MLHLYAYCKNNPINYTDPSGHSAIALGGGLYALAKAKATVGAVISSPATGAAIVIVTAVIGVVIIGGIAYKKVKTAKRANSKPKRTGTAVSSPSPNNSKNRRNNKTKKPDSTGKMQREVEKGQAPRGIPKLTNKVLKWLVKHNWRSVR